MPENYLSKVFKNAFVLSTALFFNSCDAAKEFVYNCKNFAVEFGDNYEQTMQPRSFFMTFAGGDSISGEKFLYPDGVIHTATFVDPNVSSSVEEKIFSSENSERVKVICNELGPGIVVIS